MEFNEFLKKANEGYKLIPIIKEIESFDREERFDKRSPITIWEKNNTLDC